MFREFNTLELTFCVEFIIVLLREPTFPPCLTPHHDSHPSLSHLSTSYPPYHDYSNDHHDDYHEYLLKIQSENGFELGQ